jgi:glycosyltransferase involved in cell wall biosynthesis
MLDLSTVFARKGWIVDIVTGICNPIWRKLIKSPLITLREVGYKVTESPRFWMNVKNYVRNSAKLVTKDTDVLITSSFPSPLVAGLTKDLMNHRWLHYLHEAPMVLHDPAGRRASALTYRLFYELATTLFSDEEIEAVRASDIIIANSLLTRDINARVYGFKPEDIRVVYPGVDPKSVHPNYAVPGFLQPFHEEGIPILFFPKGVKSWWNSETCLEALEKLKFEYISVFTGGTSKEKEHLDNRAEKLGMKESIIIIDNLPNPLMNSIYTNSSVVISIPRRQPFGLIPLEALICGTPPIISKMSGVSEVLENGGEVLTINHQDPDELAHGIKRLIHDQEFKTELVKNGKTKVKDYLTIDRFGEEMLDLAEND